MKTKYFRLKLGRIIFLMIVVSGLFINQKNNISALSITEEENQQEKPFVYEEDLLPFITFQIIDTATSLYYFDSSDKNNEILNKRTDPNKIEAPGICLDYAEHFVKNYSGPGELFIIIVDSYGNAELVKLNKPFEKTDIYNPKNIDDYIESSYKEIKKLITRSDRSYIYKDESFSQFYLKNIDNDIYWSQNGDFSSNDDLTLFEENHLKQNFIIDKYINMVFSHITEYYEKSEKPFIFKYYNIDLYASRNNLILIDRFPITTPIIHAGIKNKGFYEHSWVRLTYKGITIDIDPTYYEGGFDLNKIIEIIN